MSNQVALQGLVLDVLQHTREPAGLRVSEIRASLGAAVEAVQIQGALESLARQGIVRRKGLDGRWSALVAAAPSAGRAADREPSKRERDTPSLGRSPATTPTRVSAPRRRPTVVVQVEGLGSFPLPQVVDPGLPDLSDGARRASDASQEVVICAPPGARLVVEAGPGFGKTDVACARVAHLLRRGVEGANVLLLSFTRTAVREMRARIRRLADTDAEVGAVEIRTLDSFAWRLRCGLGETTREAVSFGQNIATTLPMLTAPSAGVLEYLHGFAHVFVDEAQDLVGLRAILVARLLSLLSPDAGYTVFLDPAQAIYDWTEDDGTGQEPHVAFADLLSGLDPVPRVLPLGLLHRTRDPDLRGLLLGARKLVLDDASGCAAHLRGVLTARAPTQALRPEALGNLIREENSEDLLVLFRRRAEVLQASSYLAGGGVPHRLRFGGLPRLAAPWIAVVINGLARAGVRTQATRADVERIWQGILNPWLTAGWTSDSAWQTLRRLGPGPARHTIDTARIAERLGMASLPDELVVREVGSGGPILGTIHGSKGREANSVLLGLSPSFGEDDDGEGRVLYVGLSRARERLLVRQFEARRWFPLESGRACHRYPDGKIHVEIGRDGDLDVIGGLAAAGEEASHQQEVLAGFDGTARPYCFVTTGPPNWNLVAVPRGEKATAIACLSPNCVADLRAATKTRDRPGRTPPVVNHVPWIDVTTVAVRADHPALHLVPEPWRTTRVWLAPVLVGLGLLYNREKKK